MCRIGKAKAGREKLLDILTKERMRITLDIVLRSDKDYQNALEKQDKAFREMEKAGLSRKQNAVVDRAISANNACGAVYGAAAYKQGLQDGIRLVSELREIE